MHQISWPVEKRALRAALTLYKITVFEFQNRVGRENCTVVVTNSLDNLGLMKKITIREKWIYLTVFVE
jgi:hypothetical protein